MKEKLKDKKIIGASIVTAIALAVFAFTIVHATLYAPDSELSVPNSSKSNSHHTSLPNEPAQLSIPSIGVNARVQAVGFTYKGNMGVPDNFTDVGWYKFGVVPGDEGSAVMDGHVDNGLAFPGVFKNLSNVKIGDDIYVTDNAGTKLHFVVTALNIYGYKDAPTSLIFNQTGDKYLKLITCTGSWVPEDQTDDQRLVVTAVLKS